MAEWGNHDFTWKLTSMRFLLYDKFQTFLVGWTWRVVIWIPMGFRSTLFPWCDTLVHEWDWHLTTSGWLLTLSPWSFIPKNNFLYIRWTCVINKCFKAMKNFSPYNPSSHPNVFALTVYSIVVSWCNDNADVVDTVEKYWREKPRDLWL